MSINNNNTTRRDCFAFDPYDFKCSCLTYLVCYKNNCPFFKRHRSLASNFKKDLFNYEKPQKPNTQFIELLEVFDNFIKNKNNKK